MEQELILWFWRGLLTLGMGGLVRLLIWQRKMERELTEQKVKTANAAASAGTAAEQVKLLSPKVTTLEANISSVGALKEEVIAGNRRMDDVANATSELTGQMKQINGTLHLIQEHLMGQSK